jgi:hypothetical protein
MKHLLYIALFLYATFLKAQNNIAPNLIVTDMNGEYHNLYSYLEEGKSVLLDFFIVNCSPCEEGSGYMFNLWNNFGPEGTDQLEILSIEVYNNTDDFVSEAVENWNLLNPIINLNSIPSDYAPFVSEYPNYIMICPDRSMTIFSWIDNPNTLMEWELLLNECNYGNNYTDIKLFEPEIIHCQGDISSNIIIGNVGSNYVYEIMISVYIDSILHSNIFWDGILPTGALTNESPFPIHFESTGINSDFIYFEAFSPNDINLINNSYLRDISDQTNTNSQQINIEIKNDNYPLDISWTLTNDLDIIVASGSGLDYSPFELVEINLLLDQNTCYTFTVNDEHGDGMCCSFGSGYYLVKDNQDTLFYENSAFKQNKHSFYIEPNEVVDITEKRKVENKVQSINYYNLQGQKIKLPNAGSSYIKMKLYENGNYDCRKYFKRDE